MKITRALGLLLLAAFLSTTAAAGPEQLIANADGDLSVDRSAALVAQVMVSVLPHLGDSGIAVKTNLAVDRDTGVLTLSLKSDERVVEKASPLIARVYICDVFSVTDESSSLYVSKARHTSELQNGSRRDTVIRGECKNQLGAIANIVISYDRDSYSVLINDDTLKAANPRFDVVIGPLPKKK